MLAGRSPAVMSLRSGTKALHAYSFVGAISASLVIRMTPRCLGYQHHVQGRCIFYFSCLFHIIILCWPIVGQQTASVWTREMFFVVAWTKHFCCASTAWNLCMANVTFVILIGDHCLTSTSKTGKSCSGYTRFQTSSCIRSGLLSMRYITS